MLTIFVLEDDFLQQSRIENAINIALKRNSLKCRSINIFGKPQQLLDAIVERGAHQLFFLDIQI
ncbi:MAG: DNA-binding response regulator, partial [Streptococcus gallolyticus]|nr:DNA-binding response regulator [Streptococcus gallolyticus]